MKKWLWALGLSLWVAVSFASAQTGGTPFPSTGGPSVTVSQAGPVTVKFIFSENNQSAGFEGNSSIGVGGGVSGDGPATLYVVDAANNVIASVNLSVAVTTDGSGNETSTTTVSGTGAAISMPGYSSGSASGTANVDLSGSTPSGSTGSWHMQTHSNTALGVTTTTAFLTAAVGANCTYTFYAPAQGSYTVYVINQVDTEENDFWSTDKDVWIPATVTQSTAINVSAVTAAPVALPTGSISVNKTSNGASGVTLNWTITPPQ